MEGNATLRKSPREAGMGILEMMMATIVLALVLTGFGAVMFAAARENVKSENRTRSQQQATSEIETIRSLAYDSVGLVGGNPPGTLVASKTVNGLKVETDVGFVNDNVPGTYTTYKDYKAVTVKVFDPGKSTPSAVLETRVAPPGAPGQNESVIKVIVSDYGLNTPIENATVSLAGGPSSNRTDTTSAAGEVIFPGLIPNAVSGNHYDLTAVVPGYVTMAADLPPANATHVKVAPTTVFSTAIRMFRPLTLNVSLLSNNSGSVSPFTLPSTVSVTGSNGTGSFPTSTGSISTGTLQASTPILPNDTVTIGAYAPGMSGKGWFATAVKEKVPTNYPTVNTSNVTMLMSEYNLGKIQVIVRNASNQPVPNATVTVSGGPADVWFTGTTNTGGQVLFNVPEDSSNSAYEVTFPTQGILDETIVNSSGRGTTTVVNLSVS
jgi:hypothetical protein